MSSCKMTTSTLLVSLLLSIIISYSAAQDLQRCNFGTTEPGTLCALIQDTTDQFDWSLRAEATPSGETGPATGFGGSGYYVFIETSDPQVTGNAARLYTPFLNYVGASCVRFAYHMYGNHIGELNMYTQVGENTAVTNRIKAWTRNGQQGTEWSQAAVDVELRDTRTRVGFEGFRGSDYQGDIAIDEVVITRGRCDGSGGGGVNLPLMCNFDTAALCGFTQRSDDSPNYDWTFSIERTSTTNTGPEQAQSGQGFVYLETSDPWVNGQYAILSTPSLNYNGPACLSFYYHMYGDGINTLRVYKNSLRNNPTFQRNGAFGQAWIEARVEFQIQQGDRISFDAARGTNIRGDIAIDTMLLTGSSCQGAPATPPPLTTTTTRRPTTSETDLPFTCSFEIDICSMFQRTNDNFDWTRMTGPTASDATGPTAAASGSWYLYIEASAPRVPNEEAIIETPSLRYAGTVCTEFSFHMKGSDIGMLIVYSSNRGKANPYFTRSGSAGDEWVTARASSSIEYGERIVFLATTGTGIQGDISVDNISIRVGSCEGSPTPSPTPVPTPSPSPGPGPGPVETDPAYPYYGCNMESQGTAGSACRIRQENSDSMDFLWGRDKTPSGAFNRKINGQLFPVTGPSRAQQGTYYIYMEASQANPSSVARLVFEGSDFTRGGLNCLRFWYNMNGHHIGSLSVITRMNNGQNIRMWHMKGDLGPNWARAAVDLDMNGVSQVAMEAAMTGQFSGDIAVDDLQMQSGRCTAIPSGFLWQCNFESANNAASLCGMQQDATDTSGFDWELHTGPTKSQFTGPANAYNGQYFIYIEASKPRNSGDRARVFVPRLDRSGAMCVEFYYHMYGFHIGQLGIVLRRSGTSENRSQWTLEGQQGNQWREARVTINNVNFDDQIGFVAVRGSEYSGDIALDNVRVRAGGC